MRLCGLSHSRSDSSGRVGDWSPHTAEREKHRRAELITEIGGGGKCIKISNGSDWKWVGRRNCVVNGDTNN